MADNKVQLDNRAPETQQVLRRIHGWGINWGITIVAVLFVGLLFGAVQVKFDQTEQVPLQVESAWVVEVLSPDMVAETDELSVVIDGEAYVLTKDVGQPEHFRSDRPLPSDPAFPYPLNGQFDEEVHVLDIIFKGIL